MYTTLDLRPAHRGRFATVMLALLVAAALFIPALAAAAPADIGAARQFRQTFGLRSDATYVRGLAGRPATAPWPVPLTASEKAEMDRRVAIQNDMGDLHAFGAANPAVFGGVWIDQAAGGVVEVQITGNPNRYAASIRARAPEHARIRLVSVANTLAELTRLVDRLDRERAFVASLGAEIYEVGPDVRTNRVQLGLSVVTPEIRSALERRYGSGSITVFQTAEPQLTVCNSRNDCIGPPLRGGISTNWGCTTASCPARTASTAS
jgi:hypothetical protein